MEKRINVVSERAFGFEADYTDGHLVGLQVGDCAIVADPKHPDSPHQGRFQGVFRGWRGKHLQIEDGDGDWFDIEADEIEEIIKD